MSSAIELVEELLSKRVHSKLLPALEQLDAELAAAPNAVLRRQTLAVALRAHYAVGHYGRVLELVHSHAAGDRYPAGHPNCHHYVRSFLALHLPPQPDRPQTTDAEISELGGGMCRRIITTVLHHFARRESERDAGIAQCLDNSQSFQDLVFVLNSLMFYSLPIGAEPIEAALERWAASDHLAYLALRRPLRPAAKPSHRLRYLFCGGAARSGTTAAGKMLNLAPSICVFTELYSPYLGYTAEMFGAEALHSPYFDKRPHFVRDVLLRARVGTQTQYLGDKRPLFLNSWQITRQHFTPDSIRVLNLVRDPAEVVQSYESRAEWGAKYPWQPDRGRLIAESDLSLQLSVIDQIQASEFAPSLKLLRYPDILTDREAVFEMFDFLGVERDAELTQAIVAEIEANHEYMKKNVRKPPDPPWTFLDPSERRRYDELLT